MSTDAEALLRGEVRCACGHTDEQHVMFSQQQRCEAQVYTDAPLGGGSTFRCPCRHFVAEVRILQRPSRKDAR